MHQWFTAAGILLALLGGQDARAGTYYVAPHGNDAQTGVQGQPFQTIAKGLGVLKAGDTLMIKGGTYAERIDSNSQTLAAGTAIPGQHLSV